MFKLALKFPPPRPKNVQENLDVEWHFLQISIYPLPYNNSLSVNHIGNLCLSSQSFTRQIAPREICSEGRVKIKTRQVSETGGKTALYVPKVQILASDASCAVPGGLSDWRTGCTFYSRTAGDLCASGSGVSAHLIAQNAKHILPMCTRTVSPLKI